MTRSIVIIGAGVVGLSVAYECLRRGYQVTVLEKGCCGGQASGAAAGMLAPYSENGEGADPFFQLCQASLKLFPSWVQALQKETGIAFEYTNSGSLNVVFHEADVLSMETKVLWQRQQGVTAEIVEGAALAKMEPHLSREIVSAIYYPEESHLYAPDYVYALEKVCIKHGAKIYEHVSNLHLSYHRDGVTIDMEMENSSQHSHLQVHGEELVLSTGAWAKEWEHIFGVRLPVHPIRGQICAYRAVPKFKHIVFGSQGYLVEKANGSIVCGASEDIAGFNTQITEKGISRLIRWGGKLCPSLKEQQPFHSWAGLRPATPDGRPLIGRLRKANRVILAAGHYRNGILLSPITAQMVADLIDGKKTNDQLHDFDPERFS